NSNLTYQLMRFFANELQESQRTRRDLAHTSAKARIAKSFIALENQFGTGDDGLLNLEISRQDIASYSGSSYETLFKVATELTKNGIIELTGKHIAIKDEESLLHIIEQDNM